MYVCMAMYVCIYNIYIYITCLRYINIVRTETIPAVGPKQLLPVARTAKRAAATKKTTRPPSRILYCWGTVLREG